MRKRLYRRIKRNIIKLFMISLMIFITTALFVGYYVGTSSVLDSIYQFNDEYNLEEGSFFSSNLDIKDEGIEKIEYKEVSYGDAVVRIFKERKTINLVQVIDGDILREENDIVFDNNFMCEQDIHIGDVVVLADTQFNVCGKAISPDYIMTKKSELILQPNSALFGVAYTDAKTFENIDGNTLFYYTYKNGLGMEENVEKYSPLTIKDIANNSRVKQVIGDATSPQLLSVVVVVIFYMITVILLFVYNYENAKAEKNNVQILRNLGKDTLYIFYHYVKDIFWFGNISVLIGVIVGILVLPTIMYMNQSIYNYPMLKISYNKLYFAIFIAFVAINIVNVVAIKICYFGSTKQKTKNSKFSLLGCGKNSTFHYRYRLTYISRNKKEMILYIFLVFMVGILINFCFLLKVSVEEYVDNLGMETPYEYLYFSDEKIAQIDRNCEEIKLYNLYDADGIVQNVYMVNENSSYFDIEKFSVCITKAYAEKYNYVEGDSFTLEDKVSEKIYTFEIDKIIDISTVSEVYLNCERNELDDEIAFQYGYVTNCEKENIDDQANTCITKQEIITSGKNILNIINKQITMILIISIIIEIALMYSLLEFVYANVHRDIQILKLNGYSLSELSKMFFGYNTVICILTVVLSFLSARIVVRIFLDNIMYTFVNYVEVSQNRMVILLSNGIIIAIYALFYGRIRKKINSEERK